MASSSLTKVQLTQRLNGLLDSLDNEIFRLRDRNNTGKAINLTAIKRIIGNLDKQIINDSRVKDMLLSDDETTRTEIQTIIDARVEEFKKLIDEQLRDVISLDADAATLESQLDTALSGNTTLKTYETLKQAENKEGSFKELSKSDVDSKVIELKAQHGYATLREGLPVGTKTDEEFRKVNDSLETYKTNTDAINKVNNNFIKYQRPGQTFSLQQLVNGSKLSEEGAKSGKTVLANLAMFKGTDLGNKTIKVNGSDIKISDLAEDTTIKALDPTVEADRNELKKIIDQLGTMRALQDVSHAKGQALDIEKTKLFGEIDSNQVAAKFKELPTKIKAFIDSGEIDKASDMITSVLTKISELEAEVGTKTAAQLKAELDDLETKQQELKNREDIETNAANAQAARDAAVARTVDGTTMNLESIGVDPSRATVSITTADLTTLDITDNDNVNKVVDEVYNGLNPDDRKAIGTQLGIAKIDTTKKFSDLGFFGKLGTILTLGIGHRIANSIRRRSDEATYSSSLNEGVINALTKKVKDDASSKSTEVATNAQAVTDAENELANANTEKDKLTDFDKRYKVNLRTEIINNAGTKSAEQLKRDAESATKGPEPKEDDGLEID